MAVIGEMRQLTIGGKTYTIPTYSLPIASSSVLGGIKVGSGLSIDPSTGTLTATGTSITIDTEMSDSSTNAVQNKVIKSYADGLIAALDGGTIGTPGVGKTLTALSQTNGQISATFSNISITKSQVSDFPTNVSAFTNDAGYTTNTGTVTSVRVQATSPVQSSTSTAQSATLNTTISLADAYGDTKNPYASKTKNYVLAAPSNANGTPSFRALVADDIPSLTKSKISDFPTIPTKTSQLTNDSNFYSEPTYGIGTADPITRPLVETVRANRLAFLPASQIIIEQTTDGGTTWTDAGVSDATKAGLFAGTRPTVNLPLLNGERSTNCGLRVTITAMRYNVPSGTAETEKYNYWNSTYVASQERYCSIDKFWFWIGANGDRQRIKVEAASGASPNTWSTKFNTDFGANGWSGSDWVKTSYGTFGGGTNQTGNLWNWRITFFSRMADGASAFTQTSKQAIYQIMAYGENVWGSSNNLMKTDRLYAYDVNQNATFPAKVTANGGFSGALTGNVTGTATGNLTSVQYDSTNAKLTYTKNGSNTDIVTVATLKSALGSMPASDVYSWAKASSKPTYTASEVGALASNTTYVSTITTTAGAHTAISSKSGAVSFNVPTTAAHVGAATSDHVHGNITNSGDITATAPTIANGDQIVINDASASKITNGPTFDGSTTTKYLSQKGTWESLPQGTAYSAGTGLSLSGTTFNHSNSVTAQTTQAVYPIKIDAQGHISAYGSAVTIVNTRGTAASGGTTLSVVNTGDMYTWNNKQDKATTLAGYGITDAKIANGTITLGSNTITPLTSFTETDPTVPSWAKASNKPSYNFSEIGNKPTTLAGYGITDGVSSSTTAKIFVQASAPSSGMAAGDIWIDTSGLS